MKSNTFLIWDLPTRLFHWLLTTGFIAAALIAFLAEEESRLFPYHAILGLALLLMVVLRLVWGLIGSRYARFGSFLFGPRAVFIYLKEAFLGGSTRHNGHNPGSAYAIFGMLALVLGISITGIMLSLGDKGIKEAHEVLSYALMAVAVIHVLGVVFHTLRHRENITLSMVTGRKECEPAEAIASARPVAAAIFVVLLAAWTFGLFSNYDAATNTTRLPLIGTSLRLGENGQHDLRTQDRNKTGNRARKHDDD
jgi:cytochrome b